MEKLSINEPLWDDVDKQHKLRDKLASIIASKVSGISPENIEPLKYDYVVADDVAKYLQEKWNM